MPKSAGTVGKIQHEGEWMVIFDRGAPSYFADLVSELKVSKGIVRMSFAAISTNGDGIPKATVIARIRMPADVAWVFCAELKALKSK
jgi:hypothetical protein